MRVPLHLLKDRSCGQTQKLDKVSHVLTVPKQDFDNLAKKVASYQGKANLQREIMPYRQLHKIGCL